MTRIVCHNTWPSGGQTERRLTSEQQRELLDRASPGQMRAMLAYISGYSPGLFNEAAALYDRPAGCVLCRRVGHPLTEECTP